MKDLFQSKIIVIEDSEFARAVLVTQLKKIGYTNITAPSGSVESWELIADGHATGDPYDLVITDLNMLDLDGMDLISKIKEDQISKNQKIVVISADADKVIINVAYSMGILGYLVKPVEIEELEVAVKDALNGKSKQLSA